MFVMQKITMVIVVLVSSVIIAPMGVHAQEFWQQTNEPYRGSLPSIAIASSGHVFAATNIGIFWSVLSTPEKKENEKELAAVIKLPLIAHNYPNPFTPTTMINYQLPMTNKVDLSIYNILGEKLVTLVNKNNRQGDMKWNRMPVIIAVVCICTDWKLESILKQGR
jgi:hypothetical protein